MQTLELKEGLKMCDKCIPEKHQKYWLHIADDWTEEDRQEMLVYLTQIARANH